MSLDGKRKAILRIQSALLYKIREFFYSRKFYELMPVLLSKCTDPLMPDSNSSIVKVGEIEYLGERYKLTQSMILHKQFAVSNGLDKVVVFSPNIRLERPERSSTGRHLFEFTQVDFEVAHARKEDIFRLVEDLIKEVWGWISRVCRDEFGLLNRNIKVPTSPLKVYTSHDLMERYGKDWEIKASLAEKHPFWVLCFRREFYDREDPARPGHFLNYDLIYPEGYGEALSGGERETDIDKIRKRLKEIGKEKEYREYLDLVEGKLIPSAGGGFGVERMLRYLVGAKHIREVRLFPRVPGERIIL